MKTKAAVVYEPGKPIEIEELELDGPRRGRSPDQVHPRGAVPLGHPHRARRPRGAAADGARPRGRRDHRGGRARRHPGQARRPRGLLVHPQLRHLPLVCHRAAGDLRHGRDDPRGQPAQRPVRLPRSAGRLRRDVHARHLQPVRHRLPDLGDQGRRRPAAGQGGAGRLRRPDGLGLGGVRRRRAARRDGPRLRRRRHRHQRRPGRPVRRRQVRRRRRPAGEQAGEGDGARRHARRRQRRGGLRGHAAADPRGSARRRRSSPSA